MDIKADTASAIARFPAGGAVKNGQEKKDEAAQVNV